MLDSSLEYLDLSGTSVSIQGLGYLRLLPKLKWINLANLDGQNDIEDFAGFIQEILPPNCYVNYSEGTPFLATRGALELDTSILIQKRR